MGDMDELKRFVLSVWHLTLASLASLIPYFVLALILSQAIEKSSERDGFDWAMFFIFLLTEFAFFGFLYWIRFHNNDDLETAFLKEYRDEDWKGFKADLLRALKSEFYTYLCVFVISAANIMIGYIGSRNPVAVMYAPISGFVSLMPPVLGVLLHLAVFIPLHLLMVCRFREKCATVKMSRGNGTYGMQSFIQSRSWIHRR